MSWFPGNAVGEPPGWLAPRTIPVVVRSNVSDEDMLELALVENVQRRDLNPMERARGFKRMMDQLGLTQEKGREPGGSQPLFCGQPRSLA